MRFIFILVLMLINVFSSGWAAAPSNERRSPWIIDTDMGQDDAMALVYLLNQPQIEVKAITIESDGTAHCKPAFGNIKALLKLLKHSPIPLACGRATPLQGQHHFPDSVLAVSDQLACVPLPKVMATVSKQTAKDLLIQTLSAASRPVNILALGPLTTLAEVFSQQPQLKKKVQRVYIMGGAIKVPGNIQTVLPKSLNRSAEWNIYLDPAAADLLLHSGLDLTLVPLDATHQARINQHFYQQLEQQRQTPAAEFVYSLLTLNKKAWLKQEWDFWDPLAAVIGMNEEVARFEVLPLSVRQRPEAESGATVIDWRNGVKVRVSMGIQRGVFQREFLRRISAKSFGKKHQKT